jgi:hypothetical protein
MTTTTVPAMQSYGVRREPTNSDTTLTTMIAFATARRTASTVALR